jgi:hypothetical protein
MIKLPKHLSYQDILEKLPPQVRQKLLQIKQKLPKKEQVKRYSLIATFLFFFIVGVLLIFRGPIARSILNSKISSFNKAYQAELKIGSFEFQGLTGIRIQNISLKPIDGDTLIRIKTFKANLSILRLLRFHIGFSEMEVNNTRINLVKKDATHTNYMFLLEKRNAKDDTIDDAQVDLARRYDRLLDAIFSKIPSKTNISDFIIQANMEGNQFSFNLPSLKIGDRLFHSYAIVTNKGKTALWNFSGKLNPLDRDVMIKLYAGKDQKINIPYIDQRWQAKVGFDTLQFSLENCRLSGGVLSFEGSAAMYGLTINQPKISPQDVSFDKGTMNYQIHIGENYYEMDSASVVTLNKLKFNPYLKYQVSPTKQITAIIHKEPFNGQDLFESLPKGLFTTLEGIKTEGQLSYNLDFFVDINNPDSIHLFSELKRHNFKIVHFGNTDFRMLNSEFIYTAFEHGVPVRTFPVGPQNPNFKFLNEIPDVLKNSILTSEDGIFFSHNGFIPEAITKAITADLKRGKFARGGSTISQQLVKNIFLNRNKTMARKVEEALITWLIETNRLSSKERMFEVYLNILEMGPMVYGVNEGAHFYFNKDVKDLNLEESIFMASIIPHPKTYRSSFDSTGILKPYMKSYYKFVAEKMLGRGQINQSEYDMLTPNVTLTGKAKDLLRPVADTTQVIDSTAIFEGLQLDEEKVKAAQEKIKSSLGN